MHRVVVLSSATNNRLEPILLALLFARSLVERTRSRKDLRCSLIHAEKYAGQVTVTGRSGQLLPPMYAHGMSDSAKLVTQRLGTRSAYSEVEDNEHSVDHAQSRGSKMCPLIDYALTSSLATLLCNKLTCQLLVYVHFHYGIDLSKCQHN